MVRGGLGVSSFLSSDCGFVMCLQCQVGVSSFRQNCPDEFEVMWFIDCSDPVMYDIKIPKTNQ